MRMTRKIRNNNQQKIEITSRIITENRSLVGQSKHALRKAYAEERAIHGSRDAV